MKVDRIIDGKIYGKNLRNWKQFGGWVKVRFFCGENRAYLPKIFARSLNMMEIIQ